MTGEDFVPPSDAEVAESEFTPPSDAVEATTVKKKPKIVEPVNKFAKDYVPTQDVSVSEVQSTFATEPFEQYSPNPNIKPIVQGASPFIKEQPLTPKEQYDIEGAAYYDKLKKEISSLETGKTIESFNVAAGTPGTVTSDKQLKEKQKELAAIEPFHEFALAKEAVSKAKTQADNKPREGDDALRPDGTPLSNQKISNIDVELNYIAQKSPAKALELSSQIKQGKASALELSELEAGGLAKRISVQGEELGAMEQEHQAAINSYQETQNQLEQINQLAETQGLTPEQAKAAEEIYAVNQQAKEQIAPLLEKIGEYEGLRKEYQEGGATYYARIESEANAKRQAQTDNVYRNKNPFGQLLYNTGNVIEGGATSLLSGVAGLPRTIAPLFTSPEKRFEYDWTESLANSATRMTEKFMLEEPTKLQRDAFEDVAKIGDYEVVVKGGKVQSVRDGEGYTVKDPAIVKSVSDQYKTEQPKLEMKGNVGAGSYGAFKAMADMGMTLIPAAGITSRALKGAGMAQGAAEFAGIYAGSMLLVNKHAYEAGIEAGLSPQLASLYANGVAGIEAISESINPMEAQIARRLFGGATRMGAKEFAQTYISGAGLKSSLKKGLGVVTKNSVGEGGEEVLAQKLGNIQDVAYNKLAASNFDTEETLNDYLSAGALGAATGLFMSPLSMNARSQVEKEALALVIQDTLAAIENINKMIGKGVMRPDGKVTPLTQEEATKITTELQTISDRVKSIKEVSELDEEKTIVATDLVRRKMALEEKLKGENIDDIAQKKYKDGITKINNQLEILTGLKRGEPYIEVDGEVMDEAEFKKQIKDEQFIQRFEQGSHDVTIENNPELVAEFQEKTEQFYEKGEPQARVVELSPTITPKPIAENKVIYVQKFFEDKPTENLTERQIGSVEKAIAAGIKAGKSGNEIFGILNALGFTPANLPGLEQSLREYLDNRVAGKDNRTFQETQSPTQDVAGVPDEAIKADTRETKPAPAIQETEVKEGSVGVGGDVKSVLQDEYGNDVYYHGSDKEIKGQPKVGRSDSIIKTKMGGIPFKDLWDAFYVTKEKGWAEFFSPKRKQVHGVQLKKNANILDLSDVAAESTHLKNKAFLGGQNIKSDFPFQKDFDAYAFEWLNKEREKNNKPPLTKEEFKSKDLENSFMPTHKNWFLDELGSQAFADYAKDKGYDAVKFGREIAILNPDVAKFVTKEQSLPNQEIKSENKPIQTKPTVSSEEVGSEGGDVEATAKALEDLSKNKTERFYPDDKVILTTKDGKEVEVSFRGYNGGKKAVIFGSRGSGINQMEVDVYQLRAKNKSDKLTKDERKNLLSKIDFKDKEAPAYKEDFTDKELQDLSVRYPKRDKLSNKEKNDFNDFQIATTPLKKWQEQEYGVDDPLDPTNIKLAKEHETAINNIINNDKFSTLLAEAYHKAKKDGSNPELVKAVEQSIKETTKAETPKVEAGSVGVGGDVDFTAKGGNKVVDEKGEPITVYHTTKAENISEFKTSGEIETLGGKVKNEGAYFTPIKGEYENKGGNEYAVQISIKNPYVTTDQIESAIISPEKKAELVSKGHDGVILMRNGKPAEYVVFDKSQIKQSLKETPTQTGSVGVDGENPALKDVESTAKALEGLNKTANINGNKVKLINIIDELSTRQSNGEYYLITKNDPTGNGQKTTKETYDYVNNRINTNREIDKIQKVVEQVREAVLKTDVNKVKEIIERSNFDKDNLSVIQQFYYSNPNISISEAYHKAKKDGSNPELVKAVEQSLKETTKAETKTNEEKTPTQDTPTKSDKQQPSKGQAKGSVPTTQEPVRVDKKKGSKKRKGVRAAFPKELKGFEPTNLRDAIKVWILGGGRLNKTEFAKQITATHTQEYKESEWMRREDVKENSADLIAINQFEEWINSGLDEQSVINEIYDVAATYAHKNGIEQLRKELLESKDAKDYLEANGMSREDAAAMEAYYKEIDELEKAKQEYYSELTPEEVRLLNEAEPEMTDEIIRAIHAEEITQANIDTKLKQIQNENNDGTEKSTAESSTKETVGVSKAKKEYEAELADLAQKLKEAEKAKRDKLDRISGKVDLFADEAKSNELFGAEQNLSAENIAKQLQPETDKIAKLEAEKAAFEANKENYLKKYDKQSEISEEKPLTEKEKAQSKTGKTIADAIRKFADKIEVKFYDENGNEIKLTKSGSGLSEKEILYKIAELIEKGGELIDNIRTVLNEQEWYKNLSNAGKKAVEKQIENEFNKINEATKAETPTQAPPTTSNINPVYETEGEAAVQDTQVGDGVEREKEKRKLTQQFLNDKTIRKEFKEAVTEETIYYDRLPNDVSLEEANKTIDMLGEEEAKKAVLDLGNNMKFAVRMIMGQVLIKKMNEKGYDEQAVDFVEQFVAMTTDMGQGIQALSLFDKLTPEGQVKVAKREAKKQRDKNLKNDKRKTDKIKKAVKKANEEAAEEVVEKVKKKINKVSEIPPISSPKYGEKNKVVTKSEYEKLLKELRGSMFSNVDPRIVKIAAFHIEAGAREFGKFSENMTKALGKKVKPYLKDLYKQAQDLFESKEGFTTDEQITQLELEQKGQEIKEKISKALKSGNKKSIENAIAEIYRNGELWGRYKDMAVNRLKRMSVSEIKSDVSGKAILDEFTTGLIKNIRQQAEKVGDKSSQKKEAIQIIADAYKNFEKYQEVWAETQAEFKEKYKDNPEKLAELDAYFGDILLKPFSDKLVTQAVKEGLKSLDIKIADIIKDHYTVYEAKKKELVDKLIDEANLSPTEARELAVEIEKEFDKLATEKKKQYLDKIFSSKERKKPNVKQLYEKIIEATNVGVLSDSQLLDLYADKMGYGKLTPEQANEIVRLANKVHEAPKGHLKFQAIEDLLKYQMNLKQASWYEVPQAIWYANMLSGHQTHQRNLVANIANTMFLYSNAFAQHPTDAAWMAKALVTGIKKGLLEASDVMTTGYSPIRGKMEIPPILERKTFEGIMYPLNIAKYVRRLMVASDVLLFEGQKEMRSYQLAANMARKEGRTDPTLNMRNRALELMNNIDGALDEAITIANSEMDDRIAEIMNTVTDPDQQKKEIKKAKFAAKRRAYELLEKFRPESIQEQAANFAARGTYNYTPEGGLGIIAKWVNNMLGEIPLARYAVPFTNIIANVTNDALNYTPYGFLRWGTLKETGEDEFSGGSVVGRANSKEFNKPLTEQERTDLLTKAIIGTSFMAFMWLLSSGGDDDEPMLEITANGTGDWRKNLTLREGGWQPYSVRVKNPVTGKYSAWMSYQYSPLMLALGYIGNIRDFEKYRDEKISDNMLSKYAWASAYSARSLFDMSFLSSANDAMSAFADPRNPEKAEDGLRAVLKTGKTFVIPNAYTQSAKTMQDIMDWAQKESRGTVMGYVLRDIPVARDMYNNQVNYLGEDVTPDSDVIISGETPSKEWALLIKNNSFGSAPHPTKDKYIDENDNQEKAFSQEQFFRYAKERGYIIKKFLNENYDYLSKLNKDDFKKIMEHVQGEATVYAKINSQGHNFEPDFTEYMNTKKGLNLEETTEPIVLTSYEQYFKKQSTGVKEMLLREIDSQKKNDEYLDKGLISQELYNKVSE